jgi:hypothetical protein
LGISVSNAKYSFRTFRFLLYQVITNSGCGGMVVAVPLKKKNNDTVEDVEYEEITTNITYFLIALLVKNIVIKYHLKLAFKIHVYKSPKWGFYFNIV